MRSLTLDPPAPTTTTRRPSQAKFMPAVRGAPSGKGAASVRQQHHCLNKWELALHMERRWSKCGYIVLRSPLMPRGRLEILHWLIHHGMMLHRVIHCSSCEPYIRASSLFTFHSHRVQGNKGMQHCW